MSAGDDLILNIAESNTQGVRRSSNLKGGRWTDRVKAKRVLKRKASRSSVVTKNSKDPQQNLIELDDSLRPVKKVRRERDSGSRKVKRNEEAIKTGSTGRPQQIISSLFSYNPKVNMDENIDERFRPSKPSNAPSTDRSTFSGLGLDPLIATHLSTKMDISNPTAIQQAALPPLLSTFDEDTSDRDVFIQSQTGSGKTLSYLLPILQDLLPLSSLSYIDRSIGTLAIIIAPTRELAKQISDVLESLLSLRLRPPNDNQDETPPTRLTRWLVSGLLIGGENRTHEKSRLRKGLPILVSTPGRLLDHLQNTSSFNVGKCRWLVLDEADRLMDLGFEESIKGIIQALDGRNRLAIQAMEEGKSVEVGGWDWKRRRRTVLCSATIKETIQHLAGTALVKPIIVKTSERDRTREGKEENAAKDMVPLGEKFTPPSQLSQKYVVAPLKLRLVALVALLRSLLSRSQSRHGSRIIVFLSCTDSVDYHWKLLSSSSMEELPQQSEEELDADDAPGDVDEKKERKEKVSLTSSLFPNTLLYRLHGSLPLQIRQRSLKGFSTVEKRRPASDKTERPSSAVLLCTSVASRGLDLPLVRAVIQYDLPTEGGVTEYIHRVGRTARVGKGGEAWSFVAPSEEAWVKWTDDQIQDKSDGTGAEQRTSLVGASVESVLRSGFGGTGAEFESRATQVQLSFERWVLKQKTNGDIARRAFQSHLRAYATHPADEKHMFHVRHLHIGHLAKAFALREAPSDIVYKGGSGATKTKKGLIRRGKGKPDATPSKPKARSHPFDLEVEHDMSAEKRMEHIVRKQGRLVKKGGVLIASGTDEFQIAGGYDLEKLMSQSG